MAVSPFERILFYTEGSRKKKRKGGTTAPPFKNEENQNILTNTHPNHAFYAGDSISGRGTPLGPGPTAEKRQQNDRNVGLGTLRHFTIFGIWLRRWCKLKLREHVKIQHLSQQRRCSSDLLHLCKHEMHRHLPPPSRRAIVEKACLALLEEPRLRVLLCWARPLIYNPDKLNPKSLNISRSPQVCYNSFPTRLARVGLGCYQ